jgi:hypothetical protein
MQCRGASFQLQAIRARQQTICGEMNAYCCGHCLQGDKIGSLVGQAVVAFPLRALEGRNVRI